MTDDASAETDSATGLPLRQLTRLRAEMGMAGAQLTGSMFRDEPLLGIEFGAVARVCLPDWIRGNVLTPPDVPVRGIAVRRMALSLGSAPETTRRHVHLLLDRGVFVASPHGVSLAASATNAALVERYFLGVHDLFLRLIEDMVATCDLALPVGEAHRFGKSDVIERALEILLLPIDTFRIRSTTRTAFLFWGALTSIAVRGVTYDPVLSRRYADAIPPDEVRVGISIRRLAAMLSVPYATAWRRIQTLESAGLVSRLGTDCWSVLTRNLMSDGVRELSTRPSLLMFRKIRELALLGLDPARAADHYAIGRPDIAHLQQAPHAEGVTTA